MHGAAASLHRERRVTRTVGPVAAASALLWAAVAAASPITHARLDHFVRTYDVHADLTYVETVAVDATLLTARGIHERERAAMSYFPASQSLDVVEAWVEQPDGTRLPVPPEGRFTRPSEEAQSAPGFTSSMTTTLLFPQLREGSRTHVVWRLTQRTTPLLGFNVWSEVPLEIPVALGEIRITAPASLPLHWAARGGFEGREEVDGGERRIVATIRGTQAEEPERDMVSTADFQPLFLATSLARLQDIGAVYWRQAHDKAVVTPAIAALATKLAAGRTGEAAARAVYDWVAGNIRYVAIYLDPNDGWVPHPADTVLRAGYGDCKDHVVLMQALLAALGIRAEAAMIDWGGQTQDLPLWVPQFNHAIVYLPDFDRYLNPTNPYARYDSLDRRLAGKTVVLATPEGAIGHTPASRPRDNVYTVDSRLKVDSDGTVEGVANFAMSGSLESAARAALAQASSPEDLPDRLLAGTDEGGFGAYHSSNPRDLSEALSVVATWHSPHAVLFEGSQAAIRVPTGPDFAPPARLRHYLATDGVRRHALMAAATDATWTTTIALPGPVAVTEAPRDVAIANGAGSYTATYERVPAGVRVTRRLVVSRDIFQPADYPVFEALIYAALDDARATIGLTRQDTVAAWVQ